MNAGGDTDTQSSAATVYESVLLGANGGAMTAAEIRDWTAAIARDGS